MRRIAVAVLAALIALPLSGSAVRAQTPQAGPRPNMITRVVRASLAGITLTDAEKTKLAEVRGVYAPKFKLVADAVKPIRARMQAARAAKDTAAFVAARKDLRATRTQAGDVLRGMLADMRGALTAEHQARFDQNLARVRRMIRNRFTP